MKRFQQGLPVYIDYPFESVMFRWDDGRVWSKWYGESFETERPESSDLFHQAILAGDEITAEQYRRGKI
jgi:hypothetical protein